MSNRRDVLKILGTLPALATAQQKPAAPAVAYKPKALTPREYRTAKVLADLIIPADEHSGSASQAGAERPNPRARPIMRGQIEENRPVWPNDFKESQADKIPNINTV